jgi:lysophospholipase L1-like esterase
MRRTWTPVAVGLLLLAAVPLPAAKKDAKFFFRKNDRIVFLGDSITEQYQYSTYLELYLTTHFPKGNKTFLNAGIGGDTAWGGAGRFQGHVLDEKPTAITIDFGMNDGGYGAFKKELNDRYVKNTEAMLKAAKKAGVRVALVSPNAVDPRVKGREGFKLYLETQKKFYAPLKDLAAKYKVPFVDQYAITRAVLEKIEKDGKKVRPFGDSVHTSPSGALLMAHTILKGLHAPAVVSEVAIDTKAGKAKTKRCSVAKLENKEGQVTFERTDEALPMPIQQQWLEILPYVNQLKDLNWYGLKVTGLAAGKYNLLIDGKDVATFTAEQLAEGVNLGNLTKGPIFQQADKVFKAIQAKNGLVHKRFRGVVMAKMDPEKKKQELAKRMKEINARQAEVYKLAQPVKHTFELKPVK